MAHLAQREVDFPDGVVPGEPVVVEDVQVKDSRLELVDRESCRVKKYKWSVPVGPGETFKETLK